MKTNLKLTTIMLVVFVSLLFTAEATAVVRTYESDDVPKDIPDEGTINSSLTVPDAITIVDLNVKVNIAHTWNNDVEAFLIAPGGTEVELFTDVGGGLDDFKNTILDDEAAISIRDGTPPLTGSFRPEGKLSDFDGLNAKGKWKLKIRDDNLRDSGVLKSWSLIIDCGPAPTVPTNPNPPDGAQDVPLNTCLSWDPDAASSDTTWDVLLGTDPNALVPVAAGLTEPSFCPGLLEAEIPYSWQVVAKNPCAETVGPIWLFQCAAAPPVEPNEPNEPAPVTIPVEPGGDIAAANAMAMPGDTIEIAAGTYFLTSQIEIKSGVTYRGAGPGLTIIDGNNITRAFVAWGDRFFNEDSENANDSGPKDWVLEGMTIQNCVADTNTRFSYTATAFALKTNFATLDANVSGGLDPNEANSQVGAIRLPGPDGTEGTEDDDLQRFAHIDKDSSGEISEAELDIQMPLREDEFGDESGDGGAITIDNQAVGTIQNCHFVNNHTPIPGDGDDGGAINITGLSVVTINDCLFDGNYACSPTSVAEADETGDADGDAGHIKVQGASASAITPGTTLIANRCIFMNGNAEDDGGAIQSSAVGNVVRLDSCWFEANTCWDNGSVFHFSSNAQNEVTVTNCIFVNNITKADNAPDRMIETNRNSKFINCTFVGNNQFDEDMIYNNANTEDTDGDGIDDETTDTTQVVNCIFVNNVVGDGDDILGSRNNNFTIAATNCLFFGNTLQNGNPADNTQRPDVETGSVVGDPLLDANYVPGAGSPAIDAGVDPATVSVTLTTDYKGAPRPQGAAYDIGAYEAPAE